MTDRLTAGGKSLEYARWGPDGAPTLLLLHEGLGSLGLWRDFPAQLADATGWAVAAYSRAGYGASDPADLPRPLDYMTREATEVLPDVIDAIDADQVVLFGHSDGATIAAIHAGRISDPRVRGVVLMAPHFFTEPEGLAEIARAKVAFEEGDLRARLARHHADPDIAFRGWNDAWLDPGFRDWNVADVLDGITVPVLVIQGDDDPYGTPAQVEAVSTRVPGPVRVEMLADCGHAPHRDYPKAILGLVEGFLHALSEVRGE